MKGFVRTEKRFSLCGLNCALCPMQLGGFCPGCGGGEGNQSCAIARCSLERGGLQFCWDCPDYPCQRYEGFDAYDSFLPHSHRQQDIARARELGLETYLAETEEKRSILAELLTKYNDGRRKSFFSTAVYMLPLEELRIAVAVLNSRAEPEELRTAVAVLNSRAEPEERPIKERASDAVSLLQAAADRQGISLKLNKKPKKG